ncbi:Membrane protein involved in the export of O-antigen and teichoic acid [Nonomuraea maritima]|uniref:Membrane protein involved in the export of O-antigen and teichoic acid n=1 Tax=Nonomuraea maritima TaxID=683260 RepID=A0A1G8UZ40_9ACTN|nr:polysaccharide biosynthesis C-terminal domain-containing protein [Nonomuraea maritima]SDJ58857.1 Membrane protein involved in the export of O-antigen and teichoic acid [Nonomuraea maritima]
MSELRKKILGDLRNPLFRQGYALMANTVITGVLGMGYWLLAAHFYTSEEFGRGQAVITAMRLFASLTALGFVGALARFLPVSGRRTPEVILRGYGLAAATGGVAAVGFLLTLPLWGETYSVLAGFGPGLFFLGSVVVWAVFTLQDVVLTGLRRATFVPLNNLIFGLVKMGLLVALAGALPEGGVFVSWVIPTALALIPIQWLIFGVVVPRHVRQADAAQEPPRLREMGRFLAGDFPGALSILAIVYLVPVVVATQVGEATFGRFAMAHTLASMIELLAMNMAVSLTVEGSFERARLAENCRRALQRAFLIVTPIIAVALLGAPLILRIFGAEFAEEGTTLLRLMSLAVLPRVLIEVYLSALRAQSRARALATVQIGLAALVLVSTVVLFPHFGVNAVGYGLLSSELLMALLIFGKLRKILKYDETERSPVTQGSSGAA